MTSNPDDMDTEADAIIRVLEVAKGNRASRNVADFYEAKVKSGVSRLRDGARTIREREKAK